MSEPRDLKEVIGVQPDSSLYAHRAWVDAPLRQRRQPDNQKNHAVSERQLPVRIDADVLEWLKGQGRGYQSRLDEILRTAMLEKLHR